MRRCLFNFNTTFTARTGNKDNDAQGNKSVVQLLIQGFLIDDFTHYFMEIAHLIALPDVKVGLRGTTAKSGYLCVLQTA